MAWSTVLEDDQRRTRWIRTCGSFAHEPPRELGGCAHICIVNRFATSSDELVGPEGHAVGSPQGLDSLVERAAQLLKRTAVHESEEFEYQCALLAVDAALEAAVGPERSHVAGLEQLCRIASRRRRWSEAAERWTKLRDLSPAHAELATYKLAGIYREQGNPIAARVELSKLDSVPVSLKAFRRLEQRIESSMDRLVAQSLVERAWEGMIGDDAASSIELLSAAMYVHGYDSRGVAAARRLLTALAAAWRDDGSPGARDGHVLGRLRREAAGRVGTVARQARSAARSPVPERHVVVCGFGWSGSGAVFDYCAQLPQSVSAFRGVEVPWIGRPWGSRGVVRVSPADRSALRSAVTRFVIGSVLGLGDVRSGDADLEGVGGAMVTNRSPLRLGVPSERRTAAYARSVGLVRHLSSSPTADSVRQHVSCVLAELLRGQATRDGGDVVLLNNAFHGQDVGLVGMVPNGIAVPVFRDPRDQFVSRIHESRGRKDADVQRFIATLRSHYEKYGRAMDDPGTASSVAPVSFEEFVADPSVRRQLLDRLGYQVDQLDEDGMEYHPEQSLQNIGIYRTHADRDDIAQIESAFPDHLIADSIVR